LFQGMASGHPSFGTMHAGSVDTMIKRLITPPINLSASLVEVMDAVIVMTQTKKENKNLRRIKEVVEVVDVKEDAGATVNKPFVWNPSTDSFDYVSESYVFRKIASEQGVDPQKLITEFENKKTFLIKMYERSIFDFHDVQEAINAYYKNPEATLSKLM